MDVKLVVKCGERIGQPVTFCGKAELTFGTDPSSDVVVADDPLMDKKHFRIDQSEPDQLSIQDLGSRSGTTVNGVRIARAALKIGDVIRAGLLVLEVRATSDVTLPTRRPSSLHEPAESNDAQLIARKSSEPSQHQSNSGDIAANGSFAIGNVGIAGRDVAASLQDRGYTIGTEIGRGSFGRVYRGTRNSDGMIVAVKILEGFPVESPERMKLFMREMSIHKELEHPNIVRFVELGCSETSLAWYAMEFVDGLSLADFVHTSPRPLTLAIAYLLVRQLLSALDYAHRLAAPRGPLVHRDIKPSNILVRGVNGTFEAKLCDFGLAKNFERAGLSGITMTGQSRGNLEYMSPDQAMDSKYAGPEVDVYAMGGILHFCLTGRSLYDVRPGASTNDILNAKLAHRFLPINQLRSDIPEGVQAIIDRATGRDQVRRFRTAGQMLCSLDELCNQLGSSQHAN